MNKYRNKKCTVDGFTFDSLKEGQRYVHLKLMQKAGTISGLTLQPRFDIDINGQKVCKYFGDFSYQDADGKTVIEDVKGIKTPVYRLKAKLVKALHGVTIVEV